MSQSAAYSALAVLLPCIVSIVIDLESLSGVLLYCRRVQP